MNIFCFDSSVRVCLALEKEVGAHGGRELIFSMLKDRFYFGFGCNNRAVFKYPHIAIFS